MSNYELKKLQEKRLNMLSNGFFYFTIALGIFVIISKVLIIIFN
jgi:hypothetical protein